MARASLKREPVDIASVPILFGTLADQGGLPTAVIARCIGNPALMLKVVQHELDHAWAAQLRALEPTAVSLHQETTTEEAERLYQELMAFDVKTERFPPQ